jgi:hypothetical protein
VSADVHGGIGPRGGGRTALEAVMGPLQAVTVGNENPVLDGREGHSGPEGCDVREVEEFGVPVGFPLSSAVRDYVSPEETSLLSDGLCHGVYSCRV